MESLTPIDPSTGDPSVLWAEIHRLNAALRGPDGFDTWRAAALEERRRRVSAEAIVEKLGERIGTHCLTLASLAHLPGTCPEVATALQRLAIDLQSPHTAATTQGHDVSEPSWGPSPMLDPVGHDCATENNSDRRWSEPCLISVARDFSTAPCGRFPVDSPSNGTSFRENYLVPALRAHSNIQVDLDGTDGYGSSFLEEAFGGLVRLHGVASGDLLKRIALISLQDPSLIVEVREYLGEKQT